MTHFAIWMWIIWGVVTVLTAALHLYRARLERDEEDQIFLDDSMSGEKAAQEVIVTKVNKVEPAERFMKWVFVIATAYVIVYYILDIINHLK